MFKISNIEIKHQSSDLDVLASLVSDRVVSLCAGSKADEGERIVQVSIRIPDADQLRWLVASGTTQRFYWESRDGLFCSAGIEHALVISGRGNFFESSDRVRMHALLNQSDGDIRFYGGLRFNPDGQEGYEWKEFSGYRFCLPRYEIRTQGDRTTFAINLVLPVDAPKADAIVEQVKEILQRAAQESGIDPVLSVAVTARKDFPNRAGWRKNIDWALSAFSRSRLGKVVLARRSVFSLTDELDPVVALLMLQKETPDCFHFLFQPDSESAFIGASPERLMSIRERKVISEAVAGTRPRGIDESGDAKLRDELLHSEKDQREHQFVRMTIKDTLSGYCDVLHVDNQASEMILSRGRHLVSHIEGVLQRGKDIIEVLSELHPTAAVGGYPTLDAVDVIEGLEPFDRGWYAGPVGWIGRGSAEFAVAIRSGLVSGRELSLYTGAGIVGGSDADGEWNEIEQKLQDFVQVFGLDEAFAD